MVIKSVVVLAFFVVLSLGIAQAQQFYPFCGDTSYTVDAADEAGLSEIAETSNENYVLSVSPFREGAASTKLALEVLDKSLPAEITVRVISVNGSHTESTFSYIPIRVTPLAVGAIAESSPRATICFDVRLKNNTQEDVQIYAFTTPVSSIEIRVADSLPIILSAGEDRTISVCFRGYMEQTVTTPLFAELNCYGQLIDTVTLSIGKSLMSASDAVFGIVAPNSNEQERTTTISNTGTTPLIIDSLDFSFIRIDEHFDVNESVLPKFPMQIQPQAAITFYVKYFPDRDTGMHLTFIRVHSNSVGQDSIIECSAHSTWTVSVEAEDEDLSSFPSNAALLIMDIRGSVVAEINALPIGIVSIQPKSYGLTPGMYFIVDQRASKNVVVRKLIVDH